MLFFSYSWPKCTLSSNHLNTGDKLTITSSETKDVYIRHCILLIMYYIQIYASSVWFNYLYFGGWKRSFFNQDWWLKRFHVSKWQMSRLWTPLQFILIFSKIRLLIQITLCRNARIQIVISRKNRFSAEKAINYFPSHWEKKKGTNMWNAWVLRVFLLSHASNFLMGTEDNSIQRQLYDSFII